MDLLAHNPNIPARQRLVVLRTILAELESIEHPVEVFPDRESTQLGGAAADFVAVGQNLRALIKVLWDIPPKTDLISATEVLRTGSKLLQTVVEADAVVLCVPNRPFACAVIDAYQLPGRLDAPSGDVAELPSARQCESVRQAFQQLFAPVQHDWSDLPKEPLAVGLRELVDAQQIEVIAAGKAHEIRKKRVQLEAKKAAYQSLDESVEKWASNRVSAALAGRWTASELAHDLDEKSGGDDD
jgi:hypothetical protein